MEIKFEKTSAVAAELTISMVKADYQERVDKALKDYRKKANMPGFRPGQVPMSILKKRFGNEITAEEVQKLLSEKLYGYLREEKVDMLGEPLASEKQQAIDFEAETLEFVFDIALAPQFDAQLTNKDKIPYYTIEITDEMVDGQVKAYTQRGGHYDQVETFEEGDMTKGHIAELDADGNIKEGGIQKEDAVILPGYFKNDDQKKKFDGVAVNTVITINPAKAYENSAIELSTLLGISKEEAENVRSDFSYQITEITRYKAAELTQEFFDSVFGEGEVKSEEEFRARVKAQLEAQFAEDSEYRFLIDVREYLEKRIGELEWPDALLKRIMRANNPDKEESYVEENYAGSIKELEWHLIKEQLSDQLGIKVEQEDVMETAKAQTRAQFAQYGMGNVPDELIAKYAMEQLKKQDQAEAIVARTVERKLRVALKDIVKLQAKTISIENFNKLFEKK
ncbi:MAG: trigger factor [Bacteroidaceae bacterium]|nr:trigger factor [Bacteroidaceae bacterium]